MTLSPNPFEKTLQYEQSKLASIAKLGKNVVGLTTIMFGSAYAVGSQAVELVRDAANAYVKHEYEDTDE